MSPKALSFIDLIEKIDKEAFERDGVIRIPNVFTFTEAKRLREAALNAYKEKQFLHVEEKSLMCPKIMFWPKGLEDWSHDDRLKYIAEHFLGFNITQINSQIYFRFPYDGDQFAYHQDIMFRYPQSDFMNIENNYLQTAIIIDDMDETNGGIRFVKGSHKQGNLNLFKNGNEDGLRIYSEEKFKGEVLPCKAGDVLIWNLLVVHGSPSNETTFPRMYFMNGLAKSSSVKSTQYLRYTIDGWIQRKYG